MKIFFLLLFLSVSASAQSLSELLPWMGLNSDLRFGMPLAEFRKTNENAQILGFSDEEIGEDFEGGFYEDSFLSPRLDSSKGFLLYNFLEGKLVAVYWTNKEEQSLDLTENIRRSLWREHGKGEVFFTAKTQGESIAKVQNEIFTPFPEKPLKIILRSATDGIEVSVIDFSLEKRESFKGLFESYEENVKRLKQRGMKELGKEDEIIDFLAESRVAMPVPSSTAERKKRPPRENNLDDRRQQKSPNLPNQTSESQQEIAKKKSSNLPWGIAGVLLLGILLLLLKTFKGKSTS